MGRNSSEIERAVTRTLRDSLEKLQRNADEVNQAVGDLVSACSSTRPSNTLPHMLRAQTSAASLAATLDVLSRFITMAIQPSWNALLPTPESVPESEQGTSVESEAAAEPVAEFAAPAPSASPVPEPPAEPAPAAVEQTLRVLSSESQEAQPVAVNQEPPWVEPAPQEAQAVEQPAASEVVPQEAQVNEAVPQAEPETAGQNEPAAQAPQPPLERSVFDVASLPADQQELHRRANRVAKVSMQDIKMLRPGDVREGKENHDLCARLRDDIERAHKEYERRFYAILDHPVDYFYAWMVEILGEGDPHALGEYPYSSPVARR
jgi:hypothetical protein